MLCWQAIATFIKSFFDFTVPLFNSPVRFHLQNKRVKISLSLIETVEKEDA